MQYTPDDILVHHGGNWSGLGALVWHEDLSCFVDNVHRSRLEAGLVRVYRVSGVGIESSCFHASILRTKQKTVKYVPQRS